uniref:Metallo-beta-lactamase domain-containing protein n=1 Tax=Candidatus Enterococcus mansonii TaxID=1834181 RepID=A0A242CJ63_9ENTE|nr:hypothetical protein A5880_000967 [Enterococcus sp. 4G2_DIV0659]
MLADLGILHLFSLSGMHVTFFVGCFRYFILRSGVSVERLFGLQFLFSIIYAGLTGFSVSVVRALIQSMISLSNKQFKWRLSALDCWSLTLLIALVIKPYLLFSVGGQLSYGLSFFILYVYPIANRVKNRYLQMYYFSFLLNISIIPLVGLTFFEWQVTSSLFTFLLLPVFEQLILPLLSTSLLISFVFKSNILIHGLEAYFLMQQGLFQWLSQYSTFTLVTGAFSPIFFLIISLCLLLLLHLIYIKSKKNYIISVIFFLMIQNKYFLPTGMLAFIDVGQGDSIFIQTPFHQENILIDTGGKVGFEKEHWTVKANQKSNAEFSVIPFLKSKGVKYLDKVLISHGDVDHCGDLLTINEKIPIRYLYFPKGTEKKPIFRKMLKKLKQTGTKCVGVLANTNLDSSIPLQILAPQNTGTGENKDSMVLYTKIGGRRFLFTGDLEKEGEQQLMKQFSALNIDVLKVGHHGSKTSTDASFIKKINPVEAIISCGRNNRFKHPHEETLHTLKKENVKIYRTDQNGMIYYEWTPFSNRLSAKKIIQEN